MGNSSCWVYLPLCFLLLTGCGDRNTPSASEKPSVATQTTEDPVRVSGSLPDHPLRAGDTFDITLILNVAPTYEIHALRASQPAIATSLKLELPDGWEFAGDWTAPAAIRSIMPDGHLAYTGEVIFTRQIKISTTAVPGEYELAGSARYQACTEKVCLRPVEKQVKLRARVQPLR